MKTPWHKAYCRRNWPRNSVFNSQLKMLVCSLCDNVLGKCINSTFPHSATGKKYTETGIEKDETKNSNYLHSSL